MLKKIRGSLGVAKRKFRRVYSSPEGSWLDRTDPFSSCFGLDRGRPLDRWFIEEFLGKYQDAICGRALEIGDERYTLKYGRNVAESVVFAGSARTSSALSVPEGDLTRHETIVPLGTFDCVIATNVLNFIYDIDGAVRGLAGLTNPERGVVLATVAGTGPVSRFDYDRWGDYWRFTDKAVRSLFAKYFFDVSVETYGNAPLAAAFAMGLAQEDVPEKLFHVKDPDHQIIVAVSARRPLKL